MSKCRAPQPNSENSRNFACPGKRPHRASVTFASLRNDFGANARAYLTFLREWRTLFERYGRRPRVALRIFGGWHFRLQASSPIGR
jgi:hypothetical protein